MVCVMRRFSLIAWTLAASVFVGCGEDGNPGKPAGTSYTLITDAGGTMLDWSPDGQTIAFVGLLDFGVWAIPSAGGEAAQLAVGWAPSWSPDGTMIAYHVLGPISGGSAVRVMTYSGTSDTVIIWGANPDWSPLGDLIAFDHCTDWEYWEEAILLIPPTGGELTWLVKWGQHPDWSPDGEQIAFCTQDCESLGIWTVSSSGGAPRRLTTGYDWAPRWSPDGRWIAYFGYFDWQMYVIPVEGGRPIHVSGGPPTKAWPTWSPEGDRIAFSSYNDGSWEIWIASDLPL